MSDTNDSNTNDNVITDVNVELDEQDDATHNVQLHNFFRNITNTIYNNSFLDVDSNTIYNELVSSAAPANTTADTPSDTTIPIQSFIFNSIGSGGSGNMEVQSGIAPSNRYLFPATHIRFRNIFPDGRSGYTTSLGSGTNGNSNVLTSVIQRSFETDKDTFKHIISVEGKKILKGVLYSSLDTEETNCPIIQELFTEDTMVIELPCKHVFCEEAIMHWLENESASCPICRTKLPSIEKRIDNEQINQRDGSERSASEPPNDISHYYTSILNNITRMRHMIEEEDTQRAIWNSITTD